MQQNNFQAKFKAALAISKMDKASRIKRNDAHQDVLQATIVEHKGLKSTVYLPQQNVQHIDENNIQVNEMELSLVPRKIEIYNTPHLEGMLQKKSPHMLQGWQQRWVECGNQRLIYWIPDNRQIPFGVLDFNVMSYSLQAIKDKNGNISEFVLIPSGGNKQFIFKANTTEETQKWLNVIQANKDQSDGSKVNLTKLNVYPRYWRTDRISYSQFSKIGDTGDILLFRGDGTNCLIQRAFTGSDYDHAAILLRFPSGDLYILEATGCYGVGLCSWRDMINERWFELYEKIMFRRLELDRDSQFLQKTQNFIHENMGKKYSLTPQKLLKQKSSVKDINNQSNKEERTFFCSELVAALYKELGIFDQELSAAQYWPGSLSSENKKLKILKGKLHQEQLIDFSNI